MAPSYKRTAPPLTATFAGVPEAISLLRHSRHYERRDAAQSRGGCSHARTCPGRRCAAPCGSSVRTSCHRAPRGGRYCAGSPLRGAGEQVRQRHPLPGYRWRQQGQGVHFESLISRALRRCERLQRAHLRPFRHCCCRRHCRHCRARSPHCNLPTPRTRRAVRTSGSAHGALQRRKHAPCCVWMPVVCR